MSEFITMREALLRDIEDLKRERDEARHCFNTAMELSETYKQERDEARHLADAAMWEADRLRASLRRARDRVWKLGRERNHLAKELQREKELHGATIAEALEQALLLAQSAEREDALRAATGYWESLIRWLEQTQEAHRGKDRTWDLTGLYARGPFAGWSQERMVRLADELWENEQKYPLRGDRK